MPFLVPIEVKASPLGGSGLFAKEDIPAGTKFWVMKAQGDDIAKVVPLELNIENPFKITENRTWSEEEMSTLTDEQINDIFWRGYAHEPSQLWIELSDGDGYHNHSDTPNCGSDFTKSPWDEFQCAIKDIKAGEEILDDYGDFHNSKIPWVNRVMERTASGRLHFERDYATPKKIATN